MRLISTLALACALAPVAPLVAADYVWWEGESATAQGFSNQAFPAASYGSKAEGLSGGNWLNTNGKRGAEAVTASWSVTVPDSGSYFFHTRKFWKHGPFRWRFDDGAWQECGRDCGLLDTYELATHIGANWVSLGKVDLSKGEHTFSIELLAQQGEETAAAFDCFVLSKAPFVPKGKLKPGESFGTASPGWFAFEPASDVFGKDALVDLRSLNEAVAGEKGFVTSKGDDFFDASGKPIRFWAVNSGHSLLELDEGSIDYFAARMAKMGVNMVRMHGGMFDRSSADPFAIHTKKLAKLHYAVRALKKQGIYTHLSTFFPLWMKIKPSDGIPGYEGKADQTPFGLMFYDPRMIELYRGWSKTVLTSKDPETGIALADEPAIAIYEIINEDSLFFWTFNRKTMGDLQWQALEQHFATWATKTYGSVAKAKTAWQGESTNDDSDSRLGLYAPWDMTADGLSKANAAKQIRTKAQARFYAELMHSYYADTAAWLKKECGLKTQISASNWTTADNGTLGALERWTYTAAGVIDHHGYFGGKHEGDGSGYSVRVGHTYQDRCALLEPESLPIKYNQIAGYPHIITEIAWNKPNRFIADGAMVLSCYAALQGVDGIFNFATGSGLWESGGGGKWTLNMPGESGQYPAAALTYRLGLVATAPAVYRQTLSTEDLWTLQGTGLGEGKNSDFRMDGAGQNDQGACDPLAFYVGRVERSFEPTAKSVATDLGPNLDRGAKVVTSATKELRWNWGTGLLSVNAPASQGATGFLAKAGTVTLGDVAISSSLEYGTVWVVALDGQPLKISKRILVQAFSEEQMYGFAAKDGRITDIGQSPINVREISGTVTLPGKLSGQICNGHGYAVGAAETKQVGTTTVLTLPKDQLYTVLTR